MLLLASYASLSATHNQDCVLARYEQGGHFANHRDTPRSDTHFGSLVLLLPCHFTGGGLTVEHGGEAKQLDTAFEHVAE